MSEIFFSNYTWNIVYHFAYVINPGMNNGGGFGAFSTSVSFTDTYSPASSKVSSSSLMLSNLFGCMRICFFFMKFSGLHVCTFSTFYWNVLPLFSRWTSTQSIICLKIFNFYFRNAAQLGRSMAKGVGELKSMQRILKNYLALTAYKKQRVHGLTMAQKAESYYVGTTGTKFYFRMKKYFFCQIVTINKIIVYMQ